MLNLSSQSLKLLRECLMVHRPDLLTIIEQKDRDEFGENIYNDIREAVCDELILKGFDGDKPTKYGLELENLIDEIGRLFM